MSSLKNRQSKDPCPTPQLRALSIKLLASAGLLNAFTCPLWWMWSRAGKAVLDVFPTERLKDFFEASPFFHHLHGVVGEYKDAISAILQSVLPPEPENLLFFLG